MQFVKSLVDHDMYPWKCPHLIKPLFLVIYEQESFQSARQIATKLANSTEKKSFHFIADEKECVQSVLENRITWAANDYKSNEANAKGISFVISYNSRITDSLKNAEANIVDLIAEKLFIKQWDVNRIKSGCEFSDEEYNGKLNWESFIIKINRKLDRLQHPKEYSGKTTEKSQKVTVTDKKQNKKTARQT